MHFSDAGTSDVCRTLGEDTSGTQNNEKKQEHLLNPHLCRSPSALGKQLTCFTTLT